MIVDEMLEKMRAEVESEYVAFTQFASAYKPDSDILYCFFEGKDDIKYYCNRIEIKTGRVYKDFICGGRENVININKMMSRIEGYRDASICYFVDMDYVCEKLDESIYILPYYSIENCYVQNSSIKKVILHEFGVEENSKDYIKIMKLYENLIKKFHDNTLLLNAFLAVQADLRLKTKSKTYLKIDDSLRNYFRFLVKDVI